MAAISHVSGAYRLSSHLNQRIQDISKPRFNTLGCYIAMRSGAPMDVARCWSVIHDRGAKTAAAVMMSD
jgi:hypothetical protein